MSKLSDRATKIALECNELNKLDERTSSEIHLQKWAKIRILELELQKLKNEIRLDLYKDAMKEIEARMIDFPLEGE